MIFGQICTAECRQCSIDKTKDSAARDSCNMVEEVEEVTLM